ncbi:zinc transporter 10-like [Brienomyrus brachyistius]|uniref:zinc transporter 10-like n=1 Tax=Brienomyrus brachyistius TaxID=42636 RepID=UPI0020B25C48|nr:zinc transporter 10-like [Brienomyrus brachyistius]
MGRYTGKTCRLIFMIVLAVMIFFAEIIAGYMGNSIALVSDAYNMLSGLLSLIVGLASIRLSRRPPSERSTYGLSRAEVVGALANAVFLAALCLSVSLQALQRLADPDIIDDPMLVLIVGALGLAVNVGGLFLFQDFSCCRRGNGRRGQTSCNGAAQETKQKDEENEPGAPVLDDGIIEQKGEEKRSQPLNMRGVLLHVLNDVLGSVAVVVTSAVFYVRPLENKEQCNWQCYLDPLLTMLMVALIMTPTMPFFKETISILLQRSPADLQLSTIMEDISKIHGVWGVHDIHVWELIHGRNVATLHIKCEDTTAFKVFSQQVRKVFHQAGVHSVTIQPEFEQGSEQKALCSTPCLSAACQKQSCCQAPPLPLSFQNVHLPVPFVVPLQDVNEHPPEAEETHTSTKL